MPPNLLVDSWPRCSVGSSLSALERNRIDWAGRTMQPEVPSMVLFTNTGTVLVQTEEEARQIHNATAGNPHGITTLPEQTSSIRFARTPTSTRTNPAGQQSDLV